MIFDKLPQLPGREKLKQWGVPKGLRRLFLFWEVSVSGWLIDVCGLMLLLEMGLPTYVAACLSPLPAFVWGFVLATNRIYFRDHGFSVWRFAAYVAYNSVLIMAAAWVVTKGIDAGVMPVTMKVAIAPFTFFANYFFTRLLLKQK